MDIITKEVAVPVTLTETLNGDLINILGKEAPSWCFPATLTRHLKEKADVELIFELTVDHVDRDYELNYAIYCCVWINGRAFDLYNALGDVILENLEDELVEKFMSQYWGEL
jgi:hypothetical protein